ncbi:hypothetical protein [Streptomyces sp. NPDC048565]|uniref:hypothetical protein n=1 Tax=Streptomyces sp. NPDC048565 TaxID=3155266 RepID=UPI003434BB48
MRGPGCRPLVSPEGTTAHGNAPTYGVKKGLADVGATIFCTPLPETVARQK